MNVTVSPGNAKGVLCAPPSKSAAQRLLIASALAKGKSRISGVETSEDIRATLNGIRALGAEVSFRGDTAVISGGFSEKPSAGQRTFSCGESAGTLRFLMPIALLSGETSVFTGTPRLMARGIEGYEPVFQKMGIALERAADCVTVWGRLRGGEITLRGDISSQFVTGLLFALPMAEADSVLTVAEPVESRPYIALTLSVLKKYGIRVEEKENDRFFIPGNQQYRPVEAAVEGDWSNAANLLAFNFVGGDVTVTGLDEESMQGDKICNEYFKRLREENARIDIRDCPDLGPILFALAAACGKGARFTGTRRLRIKESDRCLAMAQELLKMGIGATVGENEVTVGKGKLHPPETALDGHGDHRIVMALCLCLSAVGGTINGAEAVNKSFPRYFELLRELGLTVQKN